MTGELFIGGERGAKTGKPVASGYVQPLLLGAYSGMKAGTEIRCENGHTQARVIADFDSGSINYGQNFGDWQQPDPSGRPFPVLCARCGGILIDWKRPDE